MTAEIAKQAEACDHAADVIGKTAYLARYGLFQERRAQMADALRAAAETLRQCASRAQPAPLPAEMAGTRKKHWSDGVQRRLSSGRVQVGSDLHRLEIAMEEHNALLARLAEQAAALGAYRAAVEVNRCEIAERIGEATDIIKSGASSYAEKKEAQTLIADLHDKMARLTELLATDAGQGGMSIPIDSFYRLERFTQWRKPHNDQPEPRWIEVDSANSIDTLRNIARHDLRGESWRIVEVRVLEAYQP